MNEQESEIANAAVEAIGSLAYQVKMLGGGDSTDGRGAVEFLGIVVSKAIEDLSISTGHDPAIADLGSDVSEAINGLAAAVNRVADALHDANTEGAP